MSENVAVRNTSKTSLLVSFLLFLFYGTSSANDGNIGKFFFKIHILNIYNMNPKTAIRKK